MLNNLGFDFYIHLEVQTDLSYPKEDNLRTKITATPFYVIMAAMSIDLWDFNPLIFSEMLGMRSTKYIP